MLWGVFLAKVGQKIITINVAVFPLFTLYCPLIFDVPRHGMG